MAKEKKKFNLRSFTTFSLVISTIIMSWSGFILYVAPPGRIANWGTWKLMLFTKTEWQALHTIFSYLFFILFIIHLFFVNWRTFLTYFRSKIKAGLNRKWELLFAVAMSGLIFVGTLRNWTPFGPVMTFGENVKEGWADKFETPPVLHMETYTLEQLSGVFDSIPAEKLAATLAGKDIKIRVNDTTLRQIAETNHRTPSDLYNILAAEFNKPETGPRQGSEGQQGFGKYTVQTVSEKTGKDVSELISLLREKGIEATPETSLRLIADELGITPREAYTLLGGK
jgi:hypothetical protein